MSKAENYVDLQVTLEAGELLLHCRMNSVRVAERLTLFFVEWGLCLAGAALYPKRSGSVGRAHAHRM